MKSHSFKLLVTIAMMFIPVWGCTNGTITIGLEEHNRAVADEMLAKAGQLENRGEWHQSLYYLRIAGELRPADPKIQKKIETLIKVKQQKAEAHYKEGLRQYQRGRLNSARRQLIIALRYDPDHQKAFTLLKHKLPVKHYTLYYVKKGDNFKKISRRVYRDEGKAFFIAAYNDLDPAVKPVKGDILKLPIVTRRPSKSDVEVKNELKKARQLFKARKYKEVLPVVDNILQHDSSNEEAAELKNISYFQEGMALHKNKEYHKSLRMYDKVDPEYEIVEKAIADVKKSMHEEAEDHYRKGVKHFINEKFRAAILEWAKSLTLNPDHPKAKSDIERARELLKKLEEAE
jgi:tetratricopeptide (TPR) repeat protein